LDLVVINDPRIIDGATFSQPVIEGDMKCGNENARGCIPGLRDIVTQSVGLYQNQQLDGFYTFDSVTVRGKCETHRINGINMDQVFLNQQTKNPQVFTGAKKFAGGLHVKGPISSPQVNGYNFRSLEDNIYERSSTEVIKRPVVFTHPVFVNKTVQVENHINDYAVHSLARNFTALLQKAIIPSFATLELKANVDNEINYLEMKVQTKPRRLLYVYPDEEAANMTKKYRVESTTTKDGVILVMYGKVKSYNRHKLHADCDCDSVDVIQAKYGKAISYVSSETCSTAFIRPGSTGIYVLKSNVVSYNAT